MKNLQNFHEHLIHVCAVSKKIKVLLITCIVLLSTTSCFEDLDDNASSTKDINDFVWKAMNATYAYKDNIADLANDRFDNSEDYNSYLNDFTTPEALFESLLYLPDDVDEFSVIVPNYFDLEQILQGTSLQNGMAFGLIRLSNSTQDVFGYVRYVMPNSDADTKGVARGMIFNKIDGTNLTADNFRSLLSPNTYTLGLANYDNGGTPDDTTDDSIINTDNEISLTKSAFTENPILTHNVINIDGNSIGYLMYNGFRFGDSNLTELNNVFAEFQAANVTDLVLDLRYNGGGSVSTAIWLSSMITGQYTGEVFFKERWNNSIQASLEQSNPDALVINFTDEMVKRNTNGDITFQQNINSLNLSKVYILATQSTASASELVINGLRPYIDVVHIGLITRGKPQASITLYDSENFSREDANPSHTYALQPLVYESENAAGFAQYYDGLSPNTGFAIAERYENLGQLGDPNEPFLAVAIEDITGLGRFFYGETKALEEIGDNDFDNILDKQMIDNRN